MKEEILNQIEDNYNMGFLSAKEYYCQIAHAQGKKVKFFILRMIPNLFYKLVSSQKIIFK